MKPMLKWAGGKSRITDTLLSMLPADIRDREYHEPFLGSGALFFALEPSRSHISDSNSRLIRMYREVRDNPTAFRVQAERDRELSYLDLRAQFNLRPTGSAFLVLNKSCFNGLYRVNAKGDFNVSKGLMPPPLIGAAELSEISALLGRSSIHCESYLRACVRAEHSQAFVYLDPPYDASWTGYTKEGFDAGDQEALRDACLHLNAAGCLWMVSNHDTPLLRELYAGFFFTPIQVQRSIGSHKKAATSAAELVITNYPLLTQTV